MRMNSKSKIKHWVSDIFKLSGRDLVDVRENSVYTESNTCTSVTEIDISVNSKRRYSYIIEKPLSSITNDDIILLKNSLEKYALNEHPFLSKFIRLFGWWFIFAGSLTAFSVCPVCGQIGCPIGVGTTGILAGFLAVLKQNGRQFYDYVKRKIKFIMN